MVKLLYLTGILIIIEACGRPESSHASDTLVYSGSCGASAGVAVGTNLFLSADDESNQLRVYRRDQGGPPLQIFDLTAVLELDRRAPETDLEGAARIGERVYWISSHSLNQAGKQHANRYRFFATTVQVTNGTVSLGFVGRPYRDLLRDLVSAPALKEFDLREASRRPPKAEGALNIEGLCATPDGRLLIGFRNPIPGKLALMVPLENPDEVLSGKPVRVGEPILLDLGGLGIRDMTLWQDKYLIVAGPYGSGGRSKLFAWSGEGSSPRHLKEVDLKGLNPEAVIVYPDRGFDEVQLLSDDSSHQDCKDLRESARHFRSLWVSLESKHWKKRVRASRKE